MSDANDGRVVAPTRSWRESNSGRLAWRIGSVVLLLIVGGVLALGGERLLGGGGGGSATNETRIAAYQDWRVVCPPANQANASCALTTDVNGDNGAVLLSVSLVNPSAGSPLTITVPHGVSLESGMGFSIAGEPMRLRPYETCTDRGCFALVTTDADTLRSLETNVAMGGQVVVAVPGNQQPVTIPFSLKGFAEGYASLQQLQSRRGSFFSFL